MVSGRSTPDLSWKENSQERVIELNKKNNKHKG